MLFATDYCGLINNDLLKLNSFFYCFGRLLNIMFPEMDNFLKNNIVSGGYFLSPWFITIFINSYNEEKEEKGKDNMKIILRILDLFLLVVGKLYLKLV